MLNVAVRVLIITDDAENTKLRQDSYAQILNNK